MKKILCISFCVILAFSFSSCTNNKLSANIQKINDAIGIFGQLDDGILIGRSDSVSMKKTLTGAERHVTSELSFAKNDGLTDYALVQKDLDSEDSPYFYINQTNDKVYISTDNQKWSEDSSQYKKDILLAVALDKIDKEKTTKIDDIIVTSADGMTEYKIVLNPDKVISQDAASTSKALEAYITYSVDDGGLLKKVHTYFSVEATVDGKTDTITTQTSWELTEYNTGDITINPPATDTIVAPAENTGAGQ